MLGMSLVMGHLAAALTQGLARGAVCLGARRLFYCLVVVIAVLAVCAHLGVGKKPVRSMPRVDQAQEWDGVPKLGHTHHRRRHTSR